MFIHAAIGSRWPFRDDFVLTKIGRGFISGLFRRLLTKRAAAEVAPASRFARRSISEAMVVAAHFHRRRLLPACDRRI
jgi:hypothetical protein